MTEDLVDLTVEIVSAYVAGNKVDLKEVPGLIASVHGSLQNLGKAVQEAEPLKPPVSIRRSITPDYLISLEDGKQYKSLKRHLAGKGLTPQQYREKWGLPRDYPMVAPSYAEQRSQLAKKMGLGRKAAMPAATGKKKAGRPARKQ
jgi:predicted transcriptional regulator